MVSAVSLRHQPPLNFDVASAMASVPLLATVDEVASLLPCRVSLDEVETSSAVSLNADEPRDGVSFGRHLPDLLLFVDDRFGVTLLHQECCEMLLECLSEDSIGPLLQAVSSIPSCRRIKETCLRKFSLNFDYCTTASAEFDWLDDTTCSNIIQHPELTVTSEERVL